LLSGVAVVTATDFVPETVITEESIPIDPDIASPTDFADNPELPVEVFVTAPRKGFEQTHILRFPTNKNLRPISQVDQEGNSRLVSPVVQNSEGRIIRTTTGKDKELHYVIAPYALDTSR